MARTAFSAQQLPLNGSLNPVVWTAADASDGMQVAIDNSTVIMVQNYDASTHTITLHSVADKNGRTGDITLTVPAISGSVPGMASSGVLDPTIWCQPGTNLLNVDFSSATDMLVCALRVQPRP